MPVALPGGVIAGLGWGECIEPGKGELCMYFVCMLIF